MTGAGSTEGASSPIWHIDDSDHVVEGLDASGQPDPRYAAALGLLAAPLWRRMLATTYDVLAFGVLQIPFWVGAWPLLRMFLTAEISSYGLVQHPGFVSACVFTGVSLLLSIAFMLVQLFVQGRKGVSIGKAIARVRLVNVRTLERPGAGSIFLRFLIVAAFSVVPLFGPLLLLLSPLFDDSKRIRGWHDKATNVWLVDVRHGMNPYDAKRMRIARKLVKTAPTAKPAALPSLATPIDAVTSRQYQLEYQPERRVSVAVLGVAKAYSHDDRPNVGFSELPGEIEQLTPEPGVPVLGGYRPADTNVSPTLSSDFTAMMPPPALLPVPPAPVPSMPAPPAAAISVTPQHHVPPLQPQPQQPQQPQQPHTNVAPGFELTQRFDSEPANPEPAGTDSQQSSIVRMGLLHKNGHRVAINGIVLLGRNPDAGTSTDAEAVALQDDTRTVSKTHLAVRPAHDALEVVDLQSTNGSSIVRHGKPYPLTAGTPTTTQQGDTLKLGDLELLVVRL